MFLPQDTERQRITDLNISVGQGVRFSITDDVFHNKKLYGKIQEPHNNFEVSVSGCAETGLDIFEEFTDSAFSTALFRTQTRLTEPGENIRKYHNELSLDKLKSPYDKTLRIMRSVNDVFKYHSGITGIHETAENAFSLGKGVCQDYAHIMLSLLRMEHIPSRYVVGMMLGEGVSHAWVEALCRGFWYGFDATNNKLVNDEYIKVSCGRDSSDCSVIKGSFYGNGIQVQTEKAEVESEIKI